jgi:hypothetical protein
LNCWLTQVEAGYLLLLAILVRLILHIQVNKCCNHQRESSAFKIIKVVNEKKLTFDLGERSALERDARPPKIIYQKAIFIISELRRLTFRVFITISKLWFRFVAERENQHSIDSQALLIEIQSAFNTAMNYSNILSFVPLRQRQYFKDHINLETHFHQ